jgi:hypothetical protein
MVCSQTIVHDTVSGSRQVTLNRIRAFQQPSGKGHALEAARPWRKLWRSWPMLAAAVTQAYALR